MPSFAVPFLLDTRGRMFKLSAIGCRMFNSLPHVQLLMQLFGSSIYSFSLSLNCWVAGGAPLAYTCHRHQQCHLFAASLIFGTGGGSAHLLLHPGVSHSSQMEDVQLFAHSSQMEDVQLFAQCCSFATLFSCSCNCLTAQFTAAAQASTAGWPSTHVRI